METSLHTIKASSLKISTFAGLFWEAMDKPQHKAGFVSIIGKPNAGKSTLINALIGEKLSITTYKPQTTRHRIMGILNHDDYQLVFSDTPGIIKPRYGMHRAMMNSVDQSLEDGDVILLILDYADLEITEEVMERLEKSSAPLFIVLNKIDLSASQEEVMAKVEELKKELKAEDIIPVSALKKFNLERLLQELLAHIPESPAFYPKDQFSDKPEKFFAAEIIREQVFVKYQEEIPYSTEVTIYSFKDEPNIVRISAEIYVERTSQKGILIGKGGEMLKKVGTAARHELEKFFGKKVFLEMYVRVKDDWRNDDRMLKNFGYTEE